MKDTFFDDGNRTKPYNNRLENIYKTYYVLRAHERAKFVKISIKILKKTIIFKEKSEQKLLEKNKNISEMTYHTSITIAKDHTFKIKLPYF